MQCQSPYVFINKDIYTRISICTFFQIYIYMPIYIYVIKKKMKKYNLNAWFINFCYFFHNFELLSEDVIVILLAPLTHTGNKLFPPPFPLKRLLPYLLFVFRFL